MRALTMLNEAGDTTISWTEDLDDQMEAIIRKKMDVAASLTGDKIRKWLV